MAYQNTAFDYERTQIAVETPRSTLAQPPQLRVVEGRAARNCVMFHRAAVFFILMMGMLAAILYNRMALTELTTQVESARTQYEELVSENRRMQVELESKTSLRAIEQAAESIGMAKAESYQIDYVDLGESEQVVLTQEKSGILETAVEKITALADALLAKLGL